MSFLDPCLAANLTLNLLLEVLTLLPLHDPLLALTGHLKYGICGTLKLTELADDH